MVSFANLRLLILLLAVLIPPCNSSSLASHMTYSACKLNKQGDSIQPCHTTFPIWKQFVVPCLVLLILACIQISQEAGKMVWYSNLFRNSPQFLVIHKVKRFSIVNKAEVDVFFWNSLAFSMIRWMLAIDLWVVCLF